MVDLSMGLSLQQEEGGNSSINYTKRKGRKDTKDMKTKEEKKGEKSGSRFAC